MVEEYIRRLGLTYPVLLDENGSVIAQYSQQMAFPTGAYPQDWVIGRDGTIVYANNRFELAELINAVERALAE